MSKDFDEYRLLILQELKDLKEGQKDITLKVDSLRQDMILLKSKGALAGAVFGILGSIIMTWLLSKV